ncbi:MULTISPECIES: hypothetical protein [unclassified Crossiella]|uniref:hypothetical protein n=1 Tax=unclassified Crossiella TaxID=2620835 RepID=UPI001FFE5F90|nr:MULTISPECIES: hypothetical protein [unclassified Crossiella]MCK2237696.1 hypothetical protein [Crossiella sp. S99.2]MCK2254982.1 hypothetical protein [Crossiella sp. S99.1]
MTSTGHNTKGEHLNDTRPRPLRTIGSIVGGLTALVAGLVGSGLLTEVQGSATTGVINAVVVLLGVFGLVVVGERKVTPTSDPRNDDGRPLAAHPAEVAD